MQGTRAFRVASRTRAGFRTRDAAAGALRSHHGCRGCQELGARRNFAATILREIVTGIIHPADRRCPKTRGFLRGSAKNGGVSHPLRQFPRSRRTRLPACIRSCVCAVVFGRPRRVNALRRGCRRTLQLFGRSGDFPNCALRWAGGPVRVVAGEALG